jgi:hypothetical protein
MKTPAAAEAPNRAAFQSQFPAPASRSEGLFYGRLKSAAFDVDKGFVPTEKARKGMSPQIMPLAWDADSPRAL